MSSYRPPLFQSLIFDTLAFASVTEVLTQEQADLLYLKFPFAQGTENLQTTNVFGPLTCSSLATFNGTTTFPQTVAFTNLSAPPTCVANPSGTTDLCNKLYVDSQSALTAYQLYFNYSIPYTIPSGATYKQLSQTQVATPSAVAWATSSTSPVLLGGFFNLLTALNIPTSIPAGVWTLLAFANLTNTSGQAREAFFYTIIGTASSGAETILYTSPASLLLNTVAPLVGSISVQGTIPLISLVGYTGLGIKLFIQSNTASPTTGSIIYQTDNEYSSVLTSFAVTQAPDLLALNNTWTGTNNFTNTVSDTSAINFTNSTGTIANITDATIYTSVVKANPYNSVALTGGQIAIGSLAGTTSQGINSIAIGTNAGKTSQGANSVAFGDNAAFSLQGIQSAAFGFGAGETSQGVQSVAFGSGAGNSSQGANSVAIGRNAGFSSQGTNATAIGLAAGFTSQGNQSVAIGTSAGDNLQGIQAVAIGVNSGNQNQGAGAVAIGFQAGQSTQGANSIAIGLKAGLTSQTAGSICLNASGVTLNPNQVGCFINPIRNDTLTPATYGVFYNTTTNEVFSNQIYNTILEDFDADTGSSVFIGSKIVFNETGTGSTNYYTGTFASDAITLMYGRRGVIQQVSGGAAGNETSSLTDLIYTVANIINITFGFFPAANETIATSGRVAAGNIFQIFGLSATVQETGTATTQSIIWRLTSSTGAIPVWQFVVNNVVVYTLLMADPTGKWCRCELNFTSGGTVVTSTFVNLTNGTTETSSPYTLPGSFVTTPNSIGVFLNCGTNNSTNKYIAYDYIELTQSLYNVRGGITGTIYR